MGRLLPNVFRVVERLLNIAVIMHVLKGSKLLTDMRLSHASPRAVPVLYNCSFFGEHSYIAHASAFWMIPWFSVGSTNSANFPVLVMLRSVVIVNMNWCGVSAKKSFCIYQSTTWPGRNIGCIMNLNICIKKKKLYTQARAVCRIAPDLLRDWEWLQNFSTH